MITASLGLLGRYKALSKNMADAISWLESGSWKGLEDGKFPIDGKRIHGMIMTYTTKAEKECRYETHRRYADIQVILSGTEYAMVRDCEGLEVEEAYSADNDIEFLREGRKSAEQRVTLSPGVAAVYFPEDAHKPNISVSSPTSVRKMVVKVEVS